MRYSHLGLYICHAISTIRKPTSAPIIESTIHEHICYAYIIAGDFNISFDRDSEELHAGCMG